MEQKSLNNLQKKFNLNKQTIIFKLLKKRYPNKIFVLSAHNELEILKANELDLDYITLQKNNKLEIEEKISYLKKISKHKIIFMNNITYKTIIKDLLKNED